MPTIRQARVGEMIKRDLAEILLKEMRDPRLALVTINSVEVARDFTIAKVFISCMGDASEKNHAVKALQGAAGFLRGRLGAMIELRSVPALAFRYDTGVEKGVRMFELLREEKKFLDENLQPEEASDAAPTPNSSPAPLERGEGLGAVAESPSESDAPLSHEAGEGLGVGA